MYDFEISDKLKKELGKLSKKNKLRYQFTIKKIKEIVACQDIDHYKNLRKPLQRLKRVHIDGSFVLTFEFIKENNLVRFIELEHHDKIYE